MHVIRTVRFYYHEFLRKCYRGRLKRVFSPSTTIISNNCVGARISQDLHYPYNSPTVGLYLCYPDYIYFCQHLKEFIVAPLLFRNNNGGKNYPIGVLEHAGRTIEIFFLHYKTEDEAREKWTRRCQRVNWNDIYVIGSEVDGCTEKDIIDFLSLPYSQKIFMSKRDYQIADGNLFVEEKMGKEDFTNLYSRAELLYKCLCKKHQL